MVGLGHLEIAIKTELDMTHVVAADQIVILITHVSLKIAGEGKTCCLDVEGAGERCRVIKRGVACARTGLAFS